MFLFVGLFSWDFVGDQIYLVFKKGLKISVCLSDSNILTRFKLQNLAPFYSILTGISKGSKHIPSKLHQLLINQLAPDLKSAQISLHLTKSINSPN